MPEIRAEKDEPAPEAMPVGHNRNVMALKAIFDEDVKARKARKDHAMSLTQGQRYVLRELRACYAKEEDVDRKAQLNQLEKGFRATPPPAVTRELNRLRRNAVVGEAMTAQLTEIYFQHNLKERVERTAFDADSADVPRIVCTMSDL